MITPLAFLNWLLTLPLVTICSIGSFYAATNRRNIWISTIGLNLTILKSCSKSLFHLFMMCCGFANVSNKSTIINFLVEHVWYDITFYITAMNLGCSYAISTLLNPIILFYFKVIIPHPKLSYDKLLLILRLLLVI